MRRELDLNKIMDTIHRKDAYQNTITIDARVLYELVTETMWLRKALTIETGDVGVGARNPGWWYQSQTNTWNLGKGWIQAVVRKDGWTVYDVANPENVKTGDLSCALDGMEQAEQYIKMYMDNMLVSLAKERIVSERREGGDNE